MIYLNDIETAEKIIIKAIQVKAFKQEITALRPGRMVSKTSVLWKLNPQINSDGVLRVNGRLKYAHLCEEQRFPVLLTKESHMTTLLFVIFMKKSNIKAEVLLWMKFVHVVNG